MHQLYATWNLVSQLEIVMFSEVKNIDRELYIYYVAKCFVSFLKLDIYIDCHQGHHHIFNK